MYIGGEVRHRALRGHRTQPGGKPTRIPVSSHVASQPRQDVTRHRTRTAQDLAWHGTARRGRACCTLD